MTWDLPIRTSMRTEDRTEHVLDMGGFAMHGSGQNCARTKSNAILLSLDCNRGSSFLLCSFFCFFRFVFFTTTLLTAAALLCQAWKPEIGARTLDMGCLLCMDPDNCAWPWPRTKIERDTLLSLHRDRGSSLLLCRFLLFFCCFFTTTILTYCCFPLLCQIYIFFFWPTNYSLGILSISISLSCLLFNFIFMFIRPRFLFDSWEGEREESPQEIFLLFQGTQFRLDP